MSNRAGGKQRQCSDESVSRVVYRCDRPDKELLAARLARLVGEERGRFPVRSSAHQPTSNSRIRLQS